MAPDFNHGTAPAERADAPGLDTSASILARSSGPSNASTDAPCRSGRLADLVQRACAASQAPATPTFAPNQYFKGGGRDGSSDSWSARRAAFTPRSQAQEDAKTAHRKSMVNGYMKRLMDKNWDKRKSAVEGLSELALVRAILHTITHQQLILAHITHAKHDSRCSLKTTQR